MQLGCNTVIFGAHPLEDALQRIAWAGYQNAHLAAIPSMANHLTPESDPAAIKNLVREHGLGISGIETTPDVSKPEGAERLQRMLEMAHDLECPVVAIGSAGKTGDEESYNRFIEAIRPLAARAHDLGVKIALKGHVGQAVHNTETMLRALKDVGLQGFGVNADPSHLYREGENPEESVSKLGKAIVMVHIRDCPYRTQPAGGPPPGTPDQQIPGRGQVNLPVYLSNLKQTGYTGPLDLEIIGAQKFEDLSRCMGLIAESRGYLHRCLQEIGN